MLGFQYFLGPALFRIFKNLERSEKYVGNSFERYGGNIIFCLTLAYNIGIYFVPPWLSYQILTRRSEFFNSSTLTQSLRYATGVGVVYLFAVSLRAIGRASNPVYREFLQVLNRAVQEPSLANKAKLQQYDCEFFAWPIDFTMRDGRPGGRRIYLEASSRGSPFEYLLSVPSRVLAWIMMHSFGLKLVYPGSIQMLQASLGEALEDGRAKWILEKGGQRFKLQTIDNNEIDSMFFDRRETSNPNGKTVVITCEGNAGFYEIGFLGSPLDAGYSVIGWNHPGFGGSSGQPFPDQETNAVDAVVQFAIRNLNFKPEEIILHGWSIGGFPASWAAMNYPDIKAIVLDATFDNLLPLATARMPASLETLVTVAIENHMNLNVIDHLKRFNGPVLLIRRSYDEIITTYSSDRRTNRGNNLLIGLLQHRFPNIFGPLELRILHDYLAHDEAGQISTLIRSGGVDAEMIDLLHAHLEEEGLNRLTFPSTIGLGLEPETKAKLALFLASKYMKDYDSTHCAPLPSNLFTLPWELPQPNHNDFVKI